VLAQQQVRLALQEPLPQLLVQQRQFQPVLLHLQV
jgi:hypothetical protein